MDFLSSIGDTVHGIVEAIIEFLPGSPIQFIEKNSQVKEIIGFMNWFLPIETMIGMAEVWIAAILVYYVIQAILRWARIIE